MTDIAEIATAEARSHFSDFINRVSLQKEWILLTRRGKPMAGAVPLEDFLYFEGPEGRFDPQGIQTFDNILTREDRVRTGQISEWSTTFTMTG